MDFLRKNISYKYSIIVAVVLLILTVGGGVAFKNAQEDISDNTDNESTETLTEASDSAKVSRQEDLEKEGTTKKEETAKVSDTTNSDTTENTSSGGSSSDGGSSYQQPPPETSGELVIVTISGSGFSLSTITINAGDTVVWVNNDNRSHEPASNNHPLHKKYSAFDSKPGINAGSSWSFVFNNVGTWDYHDHQSPNKKGTVIVN